MIKKYNDKKTYTKQELASCVANASSATARAKLLMQSGKLVLKAGQRFVFNEISIIRCISILY